MAPHRVLAVYFVAPIVYVGSVLCFLFYCAVISVITSFAIMLLGERVLTALPRWFIAVVWLSSF